MTDEIQSDNPDVANEESGDEITEDSLIADLAKNLEATESKESEEETEEEAEAEESTDSTDEGESTEDEEEEESEEEAEEAEEDDVLSQIDFDALTDEQKAELAKELGSGAGKEIGKLRSESRAKDEEISKLKAQLDEGLAQLIPDDNMFSKITDPDKLKETEKSTKDLIQYYQPKALRGEWEFNDAGDEGVLADGKFYSKEQVISGIEAAQEQLSHIEKQKQRIKELKSLSGAESKEMEKAKGELSWLDDDSSDTYKKYKELIDDPEVDLLKRIAPKLGAKISRLLAHATNSMSGAPKAKTKIKLPRKKAKAVSGQLGAASSAKPTKGRAKAKEAARKRMLSGEGSLEDIITASFN